MCNSFSKLSPKYTIRITGSRVFWLLSSEIYDITLTLYTSVLMRESTHHGWCWYLVPWTLSQLFWDTPGTRYSTGIPSGSFLWTTCGLAKKNLHFRCCGIYILMYGHGINRFKLPISPALHALLAPLSCAEWDWLVQTEDIKNTMNVLPGTRFSVSGSRYSEYYKGYHYVPGTTSWLRTR